MTGYVGVDGVGGIFPLNVYSGNAYVAHVFVPSGVNQPFARVAARITLPNGQRADASCCRRRSTCSRRRSRSAPPAIRRRHRRRRPIPHRASRCREDRRYHARRYRRRRLRRRSTRLPPVPHRVSNSRQRRRLRRRPGSWCRCARLRRLRRRRPNGHRRRDAAFRSRGPLRRRNRRPRRRRHRSRRPRTTFLAQRCEPLRAEASGAARTSARMASVRTRSQIIGLSLLTIDRAAEESLRQQLYVRVRDAIVRGEMRAGFRLPSTRTRRQRADRLAQHRRRRVRAARRRRLSRRAPRLGNVRRAERDRAVRRASTRRCGAARGSARRCAASCSRRSTTTTVCSRNARCRSSPGSRTSSTFRSRRGRASRRG